MTDRRVYVVANVAGITSMASRRLQLSGVPLLGGGGTDIEPGVVHTVRVCCQCSTAMLSLMPCCWFRYAVLFVVAEIPILFLTRGLAAANNVQFFDAAVQVVFHCPAGVIAYVAVCTHVLQDVYVAETAVEPNSFQ